MTPYALRAARFRNMIFDKRVDADEIDFPRVVGFAVACMFLILANCCPGETYPQSYLSGNDANVLPYRLPPISPVSPSAKTDSNERRVR